jgi:hypothetical protein
MKSLYIPSQKKSMKSFEDGVASIKGASVVCQIEQVLILSKENSLFGAYHLKGWDSSGS